MTNLEMMKGDLINQIKKSVKNRSVASVLSVIDFERGERAKGE